MTVSERFVVCVNNAGYEASLERNKIYRVVPDPDAERDRDLCIVDESGEDYLFPAARPRDRRFAGEHERGRDARLADKCLR